MAQPLDLDSGADGNVTTNVLPELEDGDDEDVDGVITWFVPPAERLQGKPPAA